MKKWNFSKKSAIDADSKNRTKWRLPVNPVVFKAWQVLSWIFMVGPPQHIIPYFRCFCMWIIYTMSNWSLIKNLDWHWLLGRVVNDDQWQGSWFHYVYNQSWPWMCIVTYRSLSLITYIWIWMASSTSVLTQMMVMLTSESQKKRYLRISFIIWRWVGLGLCVDT